MKPNISIAFASGSHVINRSGRLLIVLLPMVFGLSVAAQESSLSIEEIVVTAEKRESSLQNTALSITAFSGDMMRRMGVKDTADLAGQVPNFNISPNRNEVIINIRGVQTNNTNDVSDPAVAVHYDGVYLSRPRGANALFFDAERVEVLRGPQGTLYGRNATAGSVNIISNKPTDDFEASGEILYGNYDRISTRGVINIPISDALQFRGAFMSDDRDGYNINDRVVPSIRNSDDADELAVRAHLMFTPNDDLSILLSGRYHDTGGVGTGHSFISLIEDPSDLRVISYDTQQELDSEVMGLSAQVNWHFNNMDLTYVAGWNYDDRKHLVEDLDQTVPVFSVTSNAEFGPYTASSLTMSHEVRLASGDPSTRLRWLVGAYYFDEQIDSELFIPLIPGVRTLNFDQDDVDSESVAVFGQLNFDINEQVEVVGGIRYTDDEKSRRGQSSTITASGRTGIASTDGEVASTRTNWKVGLNWRPMEDALYYFQVSTGYKGGGFNNNGITYAPEDVTSYELGAKNTFWNRRLQINASVFYMDYTDLQVTAVSVVGGIPGTLTQNAAAATSWGFEIEGKALISENARVDFGLGYLNAEYDEFLTDDPITAGIVVEDLSGNKLTKAPEWSLSIGAEYEFNLGEWGTLTPRIQFRFEDDVYLREFNKPTDAEDSFTRTDLVLSYRTLNERFYIEGFIKNLENEDVRNSLGNLPGHGLRFSLDPPRTYGVRVGFSY